MEQGSDGASAVSSTENGFVQKAVNYNGEMFIIEEVQLLPVPEPIKTLRLSRVTVTPNERSEHFAQKLRSGAHIYKAF